MTALPDAVNSFYRTHISYNTLFTTQGGYLYLNGNNWKLNHQAPSSKDKQKYYENLAISLLTSPDYFNGIVNNMAFIKRLNEEWTKTRNIRALKTTSENEPIHFNSKTPSYAFLSNFFPTLIAVRGINTEQPRLYWCLETAYLSLKIASQFPEKANEIANTLNPLQAKKMSASLKKDPYYLESNEQEKINLMQELLECKFTQNPQLHRLLLDTIPHELKEDTKDSFWGIGINKDSTPPSEGQNHLGHLLQEFRDIQLL